MVFVDNGVGAPPPLVLGFSVDLLDGLLFAWLLSLSSNKPLLLKSATKEEISSSLSTSSVIDSLLLNSRSSEEIWLSFSLQFPKKSSCRDIHCCVRWWYSHLQHSSLTIKIWILFTWILCSFLWIYILLVFILVTHRINCRIYSTLITITQIITFWSCWRSITICSLWYSGLLLTTAVNLFQQLIYFCSLSLHHSNKSSHCIKRSSNSQNLSSDKSSGLVSFSLLCFNLWSLFW